MADSVPKDRLQPALLDRLTDDEPDRALEPRAERLISRQHMRQSVLRDLGWLFNATRAADADDWPGAPLALRSVVNFGLPALAGETRIERIRQPLPDQVQRQHRHENRQSGKHRHPPRQPDHAAT